MSYPITPFFTFLESYEDFASFGGCFAQFQREERKNFGLRKETDVK
jgi:hypothetical protein